MKIKIFFISLIGSMLILLGATSLVYLGLLSVKNINIDTLTNKLFQENTVILSWAMNNVNAESLEGMRIPGSWAEIMVVDDENLIITASTQPGHKGQYMYKLPNLLDQAQGIIAAMQIKNTSQIATDDYMVAIKPLNGNTTLIGLKPKTWERDLLSVQDSLIKQNMKNVKMALVIFLGAGIVVAIIISVIVSLSAGRSIDALLKALEELSLGNFEAETPAGRERENKSFSASFLRIKTSLTMALERLGER